MAHGFRHVPKDRQHAPESYPPFVSRFETFPQSMPILRFLPFDGGHSGGGLGVTPQSIPAGFRRTSQDDRGTSSQLSTIDVIPSRTKQ